MLAFWAGTLPALILAGTSAQGLGKLKNRPGLRRAGGILLIGMGVFSMLAPLQKMTGHGGMQHGASGEMKLHSVQLGTDIAYCRDV